MFQLNALVLITDNLKHLIETPTISYSPNNPGNLLQARDNWIIYCVVQPFFKFGTGNLLQARDSCIIYRVVQPSFTLKLPPPTLVRREVTRAMHPTPLTL